MQLLVGLKGTGKTKNLIEAVNQASEKTNGVVICIECGRKLTFDIKPHARLVDVEEYGVQTADELYGFVCGILASNYDLTDLFIDSALKICKDDIDGFKEFAQRVTPLLDSQNVNFTMTASIEVEKIPAELKDYLA